MEQTNRGNGMKITFAYLPEEQEDANSGVSALKRLYPNMKLRKSEKHEPYRHVYLNIKSQLQNKQK